MADLSTAGQPIWSFVLAVICGMVEETLREKEWARTLWKGPARRTGVTGGTGAEPMAGKRVYRVILEEAERRELKEVVYGTSSMERRKRATVLVLADQGEFNERQYTDEEIARITDSNPTTAGCLRRR